MDRRFLALIFFACSLLSCDPVSYFAIHNATGKTKHIEIVGIMRDSIPVSIFNEQNKWSHLETVPVDSQDQRKFSFTFLLDPQQQAELEWGFGVGVATKQIVLDKHDTINTKKSRGRIKKKFFPLIGGDYKLTIKE